MYYVIIIAALVCIDLLSKHLAVFYLKGAESLPVIHNVINFTYVENTGAAFSMLRGMQPLFVVLTLVAVLVMMYLILHSKSRNKALIWGLAFATAGGIGNLIDRVKQGFVIDFIDLKFVNFAIFNLADIFVSTGTVLLFIYLLFYANKEKDYGK